MKKEKLTTSVDQSTNTSFEKNREPSKLLRRKNYSELSGEIDRIA